MKIRQVFLLLSAFALGAAAGICVPARENSLRPKVSNLFSGSLSKDFTPDRDILVDLVEIPPNESLDWHWHPGEEFHYYLEGEALIHINDAPAIVGAIGT